MHVDSMFHWSSSELSHMVWQNNSTQPLVVGSMPLQGRLRLKPLLHRHPAILLLSGPHVMPPLLVHTQPNEDSMLPPP